VSRAGISNEAVQIESKLREHLHVNTDGDLINKIAKNAMIHIEEHKVEITNFKKSKKDLDTVIKNDKNGLDTVTKERDDGKREKEQLQAEYNLLEQEGDELKK
jgi:hypothetical protein